MKNALAALALVVNAFCYGVMWWPFRYLQDHGIHPLWATVLVDLVALSFIFAANPKIWRQFIAFPGLWVLLIGAGMTNVGFNWAVTIGDVVRVVILFYLMPAWVVLLAWPLLGEKPTLKSLGRLVMALCGVVIVLKTPESPWPWPESMADGLALLGGFSFALTNIMLRKLSGPPPAAVTVAMFGGGAVMCTWAALLGMQQGLVNALPSMATDWVVAVLGLSLMISVANLALQYGASRLKANTTSLIMLCEVIFASVSSVLLGAGTISLRVALGGGLILLAALLATLSSRPSPNPSTGDAL